MRRGHLLFLVDIYVFPQIFFFSHPDLTHCSQESLTWAIEEDASFITMFLCMFGETLATFICVVVSIFFGFHCWLI